MNKSKFLKKSLAAILSVLLVVAMIPLSAAAAYDAPITRFTVNGEEVTSNGTAFSATVKDTTDVVLGAVCPVGTTLQYKDKDGTHPFTSDNNGWTATISDLKSCKSTGENTYEIPVIASTKVDQDDQPTEVEYTLTITYSPDASSGDNEVKTVKKMTGKITENMTAYDIDNANNKITITVPFGTTAAAPDDTCFTYANDATGAFTANTSGITTDGKLVVTAANGNTRQYTVVTVWENPFKSFSVEGQTGDAKFNLDGTATSGQGKTIDVKMPYGTPDSGTEKAVLTFELADGFKGVKATVNNSAQPVEIVGGKTKVDILSTKTITLVLIKSDGTDHITTVNVKLDIPGENPEGLLKAIKVSGNSKVSNTVDVDEDTRTVNVEMPANWNFAGATEGKAATLNIVASEGAVVTVVESDKKNTAAASTGVVPAITGVDVSGKRITIRVQPEDASKAYNEYIINLTKAAAAENKLTNFTLKGEIDGEKVERSAVWNGETGTVTVPYAFLKASNQGTVKVYATSSVGSTVHLTTDTTFSSAIEFGKTYTAMVPNVPTMDATHTENKIQYVVRNADNGTTTYTIIIKTEAPRTQKAFISGTLVGTNDYNQITADNTYSVSAPQKVKDQNGNMVNAICITFPHSYKGGDPYFSALELSPGASAYIYSQGAPKNQWKKATVLDKDIKGVQTAAVPFNTVNISGDNWFGAFNEESNTLNTTNLGSVMMYVVSEKYAVLSDDAVDGDVWGNTDAYKNAEPYYVYAKKAPAEKGNTMASMASTLDTNVQASVNNTTQTINITVPDSYNDNASKTFSLNFVLSKMAKAYHTSKADANELKSDLGNKDTAGKTDFKVVDGKLQAGSSGDIETVYVYAEDGTKREYKVNVKVNDPEKGFALTSVSAVCGSNTGTGSINGTTVNLVMPFGTKLFPAKLNLTASKMATIGVWDGTDYNTVFDPEDTFDLNNDIKVQVTAEDGANSQIYTIKTTLGERFSDVPADAWFAPYVEEASNLGIIAGLGNGVFGPSNPILRQDFVAMIGRMLLGTDYENDSAINFTDEDQIGDYAKPYVAYFVSESVIAGYGDGTFNPNGYITRSEAAKIIAAALELDIEGAPTFADTASIAAWAQPYVAACQTASIFTGDEANRFNGANNITRAEAAKVMVESYKIK